MKREELCERVGNLCLEVLEQLKAATNQQEFERLDKIAQRACSLCSSVSRFRTDAELALVPQIGGTPQEAA